METDGYRWLAAMFDGKHYKTNTRMSVVIAILIFFLSRYHFETWWAGAYPDDDAHAFEVNLACCQPSLDRSIGSDPSQSQIRLITVYCFWKPEPGDIVGPACPAE